MKPRLSLAAPKHAQRVRRGRLVLGAMLVLFLLVVYVRRRADQAALTAQQEAAARHLAEPGVSSSGPVVEVVGMVRFPGVYRMAEGDRLGVVLSRAGAYAPAGQQLPAVWSELSLSPGQQIEVGWSEQEGAQLGLGWMAADQRLLFNIPLDLNTATLEELQAIPGVGPSLAEAIVTTREKRGGFSSVGQLKEVKGVGPRTLEQLAVHLSVGAQIKGASRGESGGE